MLGKILILFERYCKIQRFLYLLNLLGKLNKDLKFSAEEAELSRVASALLTPVSLSKYSQLMRFVLIFFLIRSAYLMDFFSSSKRPSKRF